MDLIPGYNNYETSGYQFPDTGVNSDQRQRTLSGDRVVILPRRPSESETMSPDPGFTHHHGHSIGHPPPPPPDQRRLAAPEWRVPPHYPPESLYPGESHVSDHHHSHQEQLC